VRARRCTTHPNDCESPPLRFPSPPLPSSAVPNPHRPLTLQRAQASLEQSHRELYFSVFCVDHTGLRPSRFAQDARLVTGGRSVAGCRGCVRTAIGSTTCSEIRTLAQQRPSPRRNPSRYSVLANSISASGTSTPGGRDAVSLPSSHERADDAHTTQYSHLGTPC
jgi:hypothetical protein